MIAREELPALELPSMTATVLARVIVSGEQEGVRDLAAESTRHMNEAHEPDHRRER